MCSSRGTAERLIDRGDLHRGDDAHAAPLAGGDGLRDAADGVVVRQREQLDPGVGGALDHLGRGEGAVGVGGVGLEVEAGVASAEAYVISGVERKLVLRRRHRDGTQQRLKGQDEEAAKRTDALLRGLPGREWTVLEEIDSKHGMDHVVCWPRWGVCDRLPLPWVRRRACAGWGVVAAAGRRRAR